MQDQEKPEAAPEEIVAKLQTLKPKKPIPTATEEEKAGVSAAMQNFKPAVDLAHKHSFFGRQEEEKELLKIIEIGAISEKTIAIARLEHLALTKKASRDIELRLELAANGIRSKCQEEFIIPAFEREIARIDEYITRVKVIEAELKEHDLSCVAFIQRIAAERSALFAAGERAKRHEEPSAISLHWSPADVFAPICDVRPQLTDINKVEEASA